MAQWTTTYTGLLALLADYMEDSSDEYTDNVPGIVNRAEERCIRDLDLEIFNTTATPSTSIGVESVAKASAIHVVQSVFLQSSNTPLLRRSHDFIKMYGGSGTPLYFWEGEATIVLAPVPSAVVTLDVRYLARPTPLSASNTTNWLTDKAADLLLNACLVESERFLIAPERIPEFEQAYASALGPLRAQYRDVGMKAYEPVAPAANVAQTR